MQQCSLLPSAGRRFGRLASGFHRDGPAEDTQNTFTFTELLIISHRGTMSSPRMGVVRDSMLSRPLLIKAPLGRTKSRGLSGPGPDFTFGTSSSSIRDGGVAEAAPDFVSLNRNAVKSGLVTSKELSQYRAQMGGVMSQNPAPKPKERRASRSLTVPDITFGVTARASSPLSDLLSHQYGRRWLDEQLSKSPASNIRHQPRIKPGCVADTRTSLLRRSKALPVAQTPVKLPRFAQVPPALDTFRDQEARLRAFRAHQSESVSRRGVQGRGTFSLD